MASYMIGDVQGCWHSLQKLLAEIDYSPSRDVLYLLGDLLNRGPDSLAVLRWAHQHNHAVKLVLGNHDLHALAVFCGLRKTGKKDTLDELLLAQDAPLLFDWLRHQPLVRLEHGWLMLHAGILPHWTLETVLKIGHDVSDFLQESCLASLSQRMGVLFGNDFVRDELDWAHEEHRLQLGVNVLTRLRYLNLDRSMDPACSQPLHQAPDNLCAWFAAPHRKTQNQAIAFGHWSSLGLWQTPKLLGLDTGCIWGGCLTAAKISFHSSSETPNQTIEIIQVPSLDAVI